MAHNSSDELPITEQENRRTRDIASRPVGVILTLINEEDASVAEAARNALDRAGSDLPATLVMLKSGRSLAEARSALDAAHGVVTRAVMMLAGG